MKCIYKLYKKITYKFAILIFVFFSINYAYAIDFKVAIILPGVITDKSFNQAGYEGVLNASEQLDFEMSYSEKVSQPDQNQALSDYARRGYDLVIGHGGEFQESVSKISERFPETMFLVVNGSKASKNVAIMQFDMRSMGYVIGNLAAKVSTSEKGGFIGAQKIQAYNNLSEGYKNGFLSAKPNAEVLIVWTNDWDDIAKGKEAALNLISQGVDVIFPTMDNAVIGSLQAVKEKKMMGFGIYYDAIVDWPESVIQSAILDMKGALFNTIQLSLNNSLEGKIYQYGFETPQAFRLGTYHEKIPLSIQSEIGELIENLKDGKVEP